MTETDRCSEKVTEPEFSSSLLRALGIISLTIGAVTYLPKVMFGPLLGKPIVRHNSLSPASYFFVAILFKPLHQDP